MNAEGGRLPGSRFQLLVDSFGGGGARLERLTKNQNQVFEWAACIVNDVLRRAAKIHMGPSAVIFPPLAGAFDPAQRPHRFSERAHGRLKATKAKQ